ncbi:thioredoxin family protein [Nitratifractor sp.]
MIRFLLVQLFFVAALFAAGLQWRSSYPEALQEAHQSGKNLMIFIEAKHCPYCERMKDEVLDKPDVVRALKNFIPVRLQIDDPVVKKEFPKASVTPTIYFITAKKELLMDIVGYLNEEFFYWRLGAAEEEAERLKKTSH